MRVDPDARRVRVQGGATWADVVTAAGEPVRASEDENPGLFWGRRGAGGNFGVVTSLEFELHRQLTDDAVETILDHALMVWSRWAERQDPSCRPSGAEPQGAESGGTPQ